ncbi:galactose oxidase [Ramaria rubella]|nr:galactose oxidase [Ramaria rubella]
MQREWEEAHAVTEETVEGPPSRRANATLTTCPNGNHLWCIGGEFFSEDGRAHFYNDIYRYSPEKDEWRRFTSPTCPGPRSAHAVVATPAGGGKLFLFGGEFSSLHQTTFHHYRDFWCFDIATHSWERIDTKIKPSARSGCRMALWKHFIVLFGGFYDPGMRTNYLNDLWLFNTQEYTWKQVELRDTDRKPSPRSGFSFLPITDGVILHGGYCKEYVKGKRAIGIALQDTWLLKMDIDSKLIKWERRKKTGYAPSLRSGCTMALWQARNTGVLFGGVFDEDRGEEGMESVFYNDLYGYQTTGSGRWVSMTLRKPKKQKGPAQKKKAASPPAPLIYDDPESDEDGSEVEKDDNCNGGPTSPTHPVVLPAPPLVVIDEDEDIDPNDPSLTIPLVRYNAMLAVLRNTLYIYGGIFESHSREYTLDDFHALPLDKMDRYVCLKKSEVIIGNDDESSSEDEDQEEDEEDDSEDEENEKINDEHREDRLDTVSQTPEEVQHDKDELRKLATAFMGVSKDGAARTEEDAISTPLPGETLATFYSRSREYWAQKAFEYSDNRGKMLRRDGFSMAEERYVSYKPILDEVQKILAEAGLDEEEMKKVGSKGAGDGGNRNRR